jgi:hypothetical protein
MVNFRQAFIISASIFATDALTEFLMLKNQISSAQTAASRNLERKIITFLQFGIIALAFHFCSSSADAVDVIFEKIATIAIMIPSIPQILKLYKNAKAIKDWLASGNTAALEKTIESPKNAAVQPLDAKILEPVASENSVKNSDAENAENQNFVNPNDNKFY